MGVIELNTPTLICNSFVAGIALLVVKSDNCLSINRSLNTVFKMLLVSSVKKASPFYLFILLISQLSMADIHPQGASLNYSQKSLSNFGNPAAAALVIERQDPHVLSGGMISLSGGAEYGDIDELFDKINQLANDFKPPSDDGGSDEPTTPENPDDNIIWDEIFRQFPELEDRLDIIKNKVIRTTAILVLIATEGYAKVEANGEASFVVNENLYGGTLLLGTSFKSGARVLGIVEDVNFDAEQAKQQLATIPSFNDTDPIQELDLSAGVSLFYNPANHNTKVIIDNDSLLLVKSTKVSQFSLSYSRKFMSFDFGDLYWGVKPVYYRVGLTNVDTRLGDITDTESIFDDIKDADFHYQTGFDLDLGLVFSSQNYQLGLSITRLIEQEYNFPEFDRTRYRSIEILDKLVSHNSFVLERQIKLEAGIFTSQREWSLHLELDGNEIVEMSKDKYQWFTVTGAFASDNWWLSSARLGFSRNLTGSQLAYVNAGITTMKFLNLDLAFTEDKINLEGSELRRGVSFGLGVQFDF